MYYYIIYIYFEVHYCVLYFSDQETVVITDEHKHNDNEEPSQLLRRRH